MKMTRTLIAMSLVAGLSTLACGAQDPQDPIPGEAEVAGEINQQLRCTDCGGSGDYPDFGDYNGPVGGWVDYESIEHQVQKVGPSACNCDSGECPRKNRYNRWICVGC